MRRDSIYHTSLKYIKRSINLAKQEINEIGLTDEIPSLRMKTTRESEPGKTPRMKISLKIPRRESKYSQERMSNQFSRVQEKRISRRKMRPL